jgi:PTS system nitrogen regulatory IIA component
MGPQISAARTSPGSLMNIADLLVPDAVIPGLKVQSKKQLLQDLAARAHALTRLSERRIFETLVERERLGTTGVGAGIAIPHGRMVEAKAITGIFTRLENGIDYEAVDSQPVDLVFMLLAPENAGADHLKALARVSRLLRDKAVCEKLRAAKSPEALYSILTGDKNGTATAA